MAVKKTAGKTRETNFPFHPKTTISEVYSIEKSEKEFSLNDIPKHMLEYVGQNWR